MTTLGRLGTLVRSKNAGPFWTTMDIFFPDARSYERATASALTDVDQIAERLALPPSTLKVFLIPGLCAIKLSFPRPQTQGGAHDRDLHSGQQYVPLLDLEVT
jgi:hypothetical protein